MMPKSGITAKYLRISLLALSVAAMLGGAADAKPVKAKTPVETVQTRNAQDYQTLFPGVYSDHEKALVAKYYADNAALEKRGPIDIQALIAGRLPADTPGLGPIIQVTEDWVRYNNDKYDPGDPIRSDAAYAKSLGYKDILAYPTFGTNDDIFMIPYPGAARDKLLVSELNHSVTSYVPVYPGDTLYLVANERHVTDMTPLQGSIYRSLAIETHGSVYNQRGEKVNDVIFRVVENIKVLKDPAKRPVNPGFGDIWEAPDWMSRPEHYYTDKDWQTIKDIWSKETRRGATPLYWEDVKVGDKPAWTLDGPIESSVSPVKPWGMGSGGSRTLKAEIMNPETLKTLARNEKDGIYRTTDRHIQVPPPPSTGAPGNGDLPQPVSTGDIDTTNIHKDSIKRSPMVNYEGRDIAIRTIQNWMGDRGWLQNIRWTIMGPKVYKQFNMTVPKHPTSQYFLDEVPGMQGKHVNAHGLTKDVYIVKSQVVQKYAEDGKFFARLVWWIETIDGYIVEEGDATVRLPSKTAS
ncbi:MAG: hypothetical protein QM647_18805 [Asticcacaulis sp.]|uniref:hypothetical protein n=1 Tax=Asticcacaulis sp. TaxID=1872648 RepID=UPI0039E515DB